MTDVEAVLRATLEAQLAPIEAPRYLPNRVRTRARQGHRLAVAGASLAVLSVILATVATVASIGGRNTGSHPIGPIGSSEPVPEKANGRIAFAVSGNNGIELHTILPDGTDDRVVPTPKEGDPWSVAWSPDGSSVALSLFPHGAGNRMIWVMNADGSDARKIAEAENVTAPAWSPDGGTILYAATHDRETSIHRVDVDGSDDTTIHAEESEGTFSIFSAEFSPDGRQILFARGTDSGFDIFVMNADGSDVSRLTTTGTDYDAHWSPDGTKIAFTRQEGSSSDIFVMDSDGTGVKSLTNGGDETTNLYPEWSPDGTKIVYVAGVTGGPGPLVVMNADGSAPETIVRGDVFRAAWQARPAP
jgi:WD40 repeat protein